MKSQQAEVYEGIHPPIFALWQNRVYRTYWLGAFVSFLGTWMQTVAQGWVVYEITNSKMLLGLLGFMGSLPTTLLSLFGGVFADRFEKRRVVLVTQTLFAVNAFVLALLVLSGRVEFWHIAVVAVLNGIIQAIDAPARQAMLTDLVGDQLVGVGVAMNSAAFNTARVLGPAIAGRIIEMFHAGWCFLANALSYLAIILALWRIPAHVPAQTAKSHPSVWLELQEGLNYVYRDGLLRSLFVLDCAVSIFVMSYATLMPVFARDVLQVGKQGLGSLFSATGVGALCGAFFLAQIAVHLPRGKVVLVAATLLCSALSLFALSRYYYLSLACLVLVGGSAVSTLASINVLLQSLSPEHLRGRVMSLHVFALMGLAPFGNLFMGWLATQATASTALVTGAAVCAIVVLKTAIRADVRQLPPV